MTDPSPAAGSKELRKKATRIFTGRVHRLPDRRVEIIQSKEMRNTKFIIAPYEQTLDKIERLIAAQNNATYEAVMEAIDGLGENYLTAPGSSQEEIVAYNKALVNVRQSIAKIYGKDSTHAVTNEEQNHE